MEKGAWGCSAKEDGLLGMGDCYILYEVFRDRKTWNS